MTPKRTRRRYTAEFKAEVALAALTERQPLAELDARYQLAPAQITRWKLQLREHAAQVFADAPVASVPVPDVGVLSENGINSTLRNLTYGQVQN